MRLKPFMPVVKEKPKVVKIKDVKKMSGTIYYIWNTTRSNRG